MSKDGEYHVVMNYDVHVGYVAKEVNTALLALFAQAF